MQYVAQTKPALKTRFLLFVALSFFSVRVVMLALWSASSTAAHFAFCFTSFVMLAFWSPSTAAEQTYEKH